MPLEQGSIMIMVMIVEPKWTVGDDSCSVAGAARV